MAARWGAGEETLTACNVDFFPMDTLDETSALSAEETLEAFQSCLDPSILSIFEDTPTIETKGLDEESEATLLTALTEILDNVDDENLSPFDTLPDSDLLSGQKGTEHSPVRKFLCLSHSPPEKDALFTARPSLTGKSLPRMHTDSLQRSDGEEEEDGSHTLSPVGHYSSSENNLLDWEGLGLPLPVTFEQECEDGLSVSLGDLVRHMHPYCMAICVENEEGEQMLPEGGILLEVVDQGENGEPILAIPDMDLPVSLPCKQQPPENEKLSNEENDLPVDSLEDIVVDDDVTLSEAQVKLAAPLTPVICLDMKEERQKEGIREKSPSRRKKKKKSKEQCSPIPLERKVLRSGKVRNTVQESLPKPERSIKERRKFPKVPFASTSISSVKPKKPNSCQSIMQKITTTTVSPKTNEKVASLVPSREEKAPISARPEKSQLSSPIILSSQQPDEKPKHPAPVPEKQEDSAPAPSTVSLEIPAAAPIPMTTPVTEALPPVAPSLPEPKPKSLSLAEYRQLRQQKKPAPVENQDNGNSSKWPSLPELPKELPPIPYLPEPSPKDPRRPNPKATNTQTEDIKPAWQPRGPCAPPTPEALLVPPAYMASSASKVSAAAPVQKVKETPEPSKSNLQQTLETSKPVSPQKIPASSPNLVKNLKTHQHTTAEPCVPQSSDSPALKPETSSRLDERPQSHSVSTKLVELIKICPKTTTKALKSIAAAASAPSASQISTGVLNVPEANPRTLIDSSISPDRRTSKASDTRVASATPPADTRSQKVEPVVLESKGNPTMTSKPQRTKDPTQELIEAFTNEIGIEAADLTSLLEQFEETQAKEDKCLLGVSGRAAAVGNCSVDMAPEKSVVERVRATDLSSTAALTPPATPPHQMWKPIAPVALLGKSKAAELSKSNPSKVIQIEPHPLPTGRSRSKPTFASSATVAPEVACMDHDYCIPSKGTGEPGKRWNVKQLSFITIKPIKPAETTTQSLPAAQPLPNQPTTKDMDKTQAQEFPLTEPLDHRTDGMQRSSVLETPDASPARQESVKDESPRRGPFGRSYRRPEASRTPSPSSSPKERTRGRSRKRKLHRSPSPASSSSESDSHSTRSQSRSRSPPRKRYHPHHSRNSSSSSCSSCSSPSVSRSPPRRRRYSYTSSRSGSWSRSRSRSLSPERQSQWGKSRINRPSCGPGYGYSPNPNMEKGKKSKEKAIEERRVVYVGRIRGTMTQKELRDRFSLFGEIEDCTLHFRDHGDNYGFVTYYDTKDAFTAIENGSKLRQPDELPFDLCFGGRRQFCQTSYADLDSSREFEPLSARGKLHALDFDTLLKQAQQNLKR